MNRSIIPVWFSIFLTFVALGEPGPAEARSRVGGALWVEYLDSEEADKDIWIGTLGMDNSKEYWSLVKWIGSSHLMISRGSRFVDTGSGVEEYNAAAWGLGFFTSLRLGPQLGPLGLFVEAGPGMLFTTKEFPPGGTHWNFTRRYGYGASVRLKGNLHLGFSFRHLHVSNGKGAGHPDNPAYDGNGFVIELRN